MGTSHNLLREINLAFCQRQGLALLHTANQSLADERDRWFLWVPVGLGSGVCAYFSLSEEPSLLTASLAAMAGSVFLAFAILAWRQAPLMRLAIAFLGLMGLGFALAKARTEWVRAPIVLEELEAVMLEGWLSEIRAGNDGNARLIIHPTYVERLPAAQLPEKVRLSYRYDVSQISPGDRLRVRVSLMPPPEPVSPDGFDFARQSWFDRIGALGFTYGRVEVTGSAADLGPFGRLQTRLTRLRVAIAVRIRDVIKGPAGPLAAALITGDRSGIAPEHLQALRDASLAHLLAISGLHMGLAGWALYSIVRAGIALWPGAALRLPVKKLAAGAGLVGATIYLGLSGAPISAQRAYIMLALVLVAIILDRPAFTLRMVAIAATAILILQPESLLEAGFQMSFAACTGLVAAYEGRRQWNARRERKGGRRWTAPPGVFSRATAYIKGLVFTSLLAGLATAPFAAYHFNQFANYGLIGNVLAVPIMAFVIMPLGVLALITMPFGADALFLKGMGVGIEYVVLVAERVASWPVAVSHVSIWPSWAFALVIMGGLWLCLWQRQWRYAGVVVLGAGVLFGRLAPPPDLVIDRDAENIAVLSKQGALIVMSKRKRFTADSWSRQSGQGPTYHPPAEDEFACDVMGCVYEEEGRPIVAFVADGRAFDDDCLSADILVSSEPVPFGCDGPSLIVDPWDVRDNGSYAIWFNKDGYRVRTASSVRGKRPWVGSGRKRSNNSG
ncbi:MAG: ComEC family competence protein [Alphaproteobacteria bacterium]|nr:MAG: ComEC family competence protein [Alphaproteobacteria bacterium]